MTREEAIQILSTRDWSGMLCGYTSGYTEALNMAIEALSADAVSREQYDYVCEEYNRLVHNAVCTKLCDENCEYKKGNTCYHAREHYAVDSVLSADRPTPNYITESANDVDETEDEVIERPIIEHDREWIIGCIEHDGFIKTDRFDKANQIILDALSADAVQGWIPCSERLPSEDECGWYLVTVKGHELFVDVAPFNDELWKGIANHQEVIAWMPLPKPYKGGDNE